MHFLNVVRRRGTRYLTETEAVEKLIREISRLDYGRNLVGRRIIYLFLIIVLLAWLLLAAVAIVRLF